MKNMEFDFSISFDGDIEDLSPTEGTMIECTSVLKTLIKKNLISIGERSEGTVRIENKVIHLEYRVCVNVGEDWDSDEWDDIEETYPISVLYPKH